MARERVQLMIGALSAVVASLVLLATSRGLKRASEKGEAVLPSPVRLSEAADDHGSGNAEGSISRGPPKMMHLDARHTNRSPFVGPTQARLAWTFDAKDPIEAAPAMLDDGTIVVATLGGKVFGVDGDGRQRFVADLEDRVYSSPLVTDDGIFAGSDAHKFFGLTSAGAVRWKLDTDGDADTAAVPAPWGGIVFASGRLVYAAMPNGTLLWRLAVRRKAFSSPAVGADGTVFVGSQDDRLYAISPNGSLRWRINLEADVDCSPAIGDDGTVFVGTDRGDIMAVVPHDGTIRWRTRVGGYVRGAISVARNGSVLAGTYGPMPHLVALDPGSGAVRWSFRIAGTGAAEFGIHGGPVEDAEGRLYFGAQDDFVYALTSEGQFLWKYKTQGDVDAPVVISPQGELLVGSDDGKLYALAASHGLGERARLGEPAARHDE